MKNETEGSVQLVASNKPQSPHHAILTGELAWRSKAEEVKVKGRNSSRTAQDHHIRDALQVWKG